MLEIKTLNTGYDKKQILFDVSLNVKQGEIVTIIGPNGAGKSTILKAISGLIKVWNGEIVFDNKIINGNISSKNIKLGLTYSPQGNRVFDELSVKENLEIGGYLLSKKELPQRIELVLETFPILKERLRQISGSLSGGEKQMLALARVLIPSPKLLLLDEPSLGLAPNFLNDVFNKLKELNTQLGLTMLIVEQKVKEVLAISNRTYSLKLGKIVFEGHSSDLVNDKEKLRELFL